MTVYKTVELVGTSEQNWADAVKKGYEKASETIDGIRNIEIIRSDVKVKEDTGDLIYRVRMNLSFELK